MAAQPPADPTALLTLALSSPPADQPKHLYKAKLALKDQPHLISTIVGYILPYVGGEGGGLLTDWMVDIIELAVCRSALPVEAKAQLCLQSLETLAQLLVTSPPKLTNLLVQVFSSLYPILFRYLCQNRHLSHVWTILAACKSCILGWATSPDGQTNGGKPISRGARFQAIKFLQKVILVQTKTGNDPRANNPRTDPNIVSCPPDHPFLAPQALEAEGVKLIEFVLTTMYISRDCDLITCILNTFSSLVKLRPNLAVVLVPALTGWTPDALAGLPRGDVRSVEKIVKATMSVLDKSPPAASFRPSIREALQRQAERMDSAYKIAIEEGRQLKRQLTSQAKGVPSTGEPALKKARIDSPAPPTPSTSQPPSSLPPASSSLPLAPLPPTLLPNAPLIDVSTLPINLVTELVIQNLQTLTPENLQSTIADLRRFLLHHSSTPNLPPLPAPLQLLSQSILPETSSAATEAPAGQADEGAVNPLEMGENEDEDEVLPPPRSTESAPPDQPTNAVPTTSASAPQLPSNVSKSLPATSKTTAFSLPPPLPLPPSARQALILSSIRRIYESANPLPSPPRSESGISEDADDAASPGEARKTELWMVLLSRLVTRGRDELVVKGEEAVKDEEEDGKGDVLKDEVRRAMVEFVCEDFDVRYPLASLWLNEEWYNDSLLASEDERQKPRYRTSLTLILSRYLPRMTGFALHRLLTDLPEIPISVLGQLQSLCTDSADRTKGKAGMKILKEIAVERPPLREEALRILLELCTHSDANTRNPAIATVRQWIPEPKAMSETIKTFALRLLHRLAKLGKAPKEETVVGKEGKQGDEKKLDSVLSPESEAEAKEAKMDEDPVDAVAEEDREADAELVESRYLPEKLELPVEQETVRQHVELAFALTKKVPELLDAIFTTYPILSPPIQAHFRPILSPLIKSLGPNNGKLLTLLRTFPPGADSLVLHVLHVLGEPKEEGGPRVKMSVPLVALVKGLVAERDLDPRFIVPIVPEMDKADIRRHLPKIVSLLNGKTSERDIFKSVFNSIVSVPGQPRTANGAVGVQKLKQSELFSPAELMVLLHRMEKQSGLKSTLEAIDICFAMTDVYKSDILQTVMQQVSDEPELPTLFMRTVIKSVQTYKSLTSFVSTNLLSRLISKKIWTSPQLWEGFVRCAKNLGVSSYGALLQLPREQIKEIVMRSDGRALKAGLREFVLKKAGGNAARLPAWFEEVFGESNPSSPAPAAAPSSDASTPGSAMAMDESK